MLYSGGLVRDEGFRGAVERLAGCEGIVVRQTKLDKPYIIKQLSALCELKEAPEILYRARQLLARTE